MSAKKIIFFTPELSGYFYYNLEYMSQNYDVKIMVFYYPYEKDAPYDFELTGDIEFHSINTLKEDRLINISTSFNPDLIMVSGWNDRLFRRIGRVFKRKSIPVVMSTDNLWNNTFKQYIFLLFGYKFIKTFSDHVWVSGYPQYFYMRKLGFKEDEIILNYYNGNYLNKNQLALDHFSQKEKKYPKTIVFVGRFVDYKMPDLLAEAFDEIQKDLFEDWQLILIGTGKLKNKINKIKNKNIIIKPFMQPAELNEYIVKQGVFCLPSHNEHWGLVVHEAASVGMPLILSDTVGAASTFLISGYNGYRFKSGNKKSLKKKLSLIMSESDEELLLMGKRSLSMSKRIDCDIWASSILSILK